MVDIRKNTLSQINLFNGKISMPKGFEIDRDILQKDIITQKVQDCTFPFSRDWDKLNTYLREHIAVEHDLTLVNKLTTGYMFKPNQTSYPEKDINEVDLRNSPDYTMLYGVNVENCSVRIYYHDNRRKGRSWDIELLENKFIMFPSNLRYFITNNQEDKLNLILKITYEYI
tara:strand:- start:1426 stop:1938 length:513 start_codon:yes stop_codon:yes gene_type:complete